MFSLESLGCVNVFSRLWGMFY